MGGEVGSMGSLGFTAREWVREHLLKAQTSMPKYMIQHNIYA